MAQGEATLLLKIKQIGQAVLDRFVVTLGDVLNIVGKIPQFLSEAIAAFKEEEAAINSLNQSMINAGIFTGELRAKYLDMADALAKVTTFSDDQIIAAEGILQSYIKTIPITEELLEATLNLAVGKKKDLASAAELVGKTIGTETDVLKRQGIVVKEGITANEKMGNVIEAVDGKFKNYARNLTLGLGAQEMANKQFNEFLENVGGSLSSTSILLSRATTKVLEFFNSFFDKSASKQSLEELGKSIAKVRQEITAAQMRGARLGVVDTSGLEAELEVLEQARQKIIDGEKAALAEKTRIRDEDRAKTIEQRRAQTEEDLIQLVVDEQIRNDAELSAKVAHFDNIIATSTSHAERLNALREKEKIRQKIANSEEVKSEDQKSKELLAHRSAFLSQMASLQSSGNKVLLTIGKAAAIAQITVSAAESAESGRKWGTALGGPPLGAAFAALSYAASAASIARVMGVQLAEGGIVMPQPGGVQATIAEAGQAEAVIPLDRAGEFGLGGGTTIIFQGPIMGNESQAEEFARAIDRSLLKLRQSNQSVAFETDVI